VIEKKMLKVRNCIHFYEVHYNIAATVK